VVREVRVGATPNGRNSAPLFLTSSWKRTSAEFPKGRCKSWTLWFQISIRLPKALANSGTDRLANALKEITVSSLARFLGRFQNRVFRAEPRTACRWRCERPSSRCAAERG